MRMRKKSASFFPKKFSKSSVSRIVPKKCKSGAFGDFELPVFAKWKKLNLRPFVDIKQSCEKSFRKPKEHAEKNFFVKGETRTYVLLLGRCQKNPDKPLCATYISVIVKRSVFRKLKKAATLLVLKKRKKGKSLL